jgi:hypothetical protein
MVESVLISFGLFGVAGRLLSKSGNMVLISSVLVPTMSFSCPILAVGVVEARLGTVICGMCNRAILSYNATRDGTCLVEEACVEVHSIWDAIADTETKGGRRLLFLPRESGQFGRGRLSKNKDILGFFRRIKNWIMKVEYSVNLDRKTAFR